MNSRIVSVPRYQVTLDVYMCRCVEWDVKLYYTVPYRVYMHYLVKQETNKMKKAHRETQRKHRAPKIFAPPQTPSRGRRTAKI